MNDFGNIFFNKDSKESYELYKGKFYKKVFVLGPGTSFGELALIDIKNTRAATIKSEETVYFLTLDRDVFKSSV